MTPFSNLDLMWKNGLWCGLNLSTMESFIGFHTSSYNKLSSEFEYIPHASVLKFLER
jgi:hypothetical protein